MLYYAQINMRVGKMLSGKITPEWLKSQNACTQGYQWFNSQHERNEIVVLKKLINEERFEWANWLIVRRLHNSAHIVLYSEYAATLAITAARTVYLEPTFTTWASKWLSGDNRTTSAAVLATKSAISNSWSISGIVGYTELAARSAEAASWSAVKSTETVLTEMVEPAESAAVSAVLAVRYAESASRINELPIELTVPIIRYKIITYGISLLGEK